MHGSLSLAGSPSDFFEEPKERLDAQKTSERVKVFAEKQIGILRIMEDSGQILKARECDLGALIQDKRAEDLYQESFYWEGAVLIDFSLEELEALFYILFGYNI